MSPRWRSSCCGCPGGEDLPELAELVLDPGAGPAARSHPAARRPNGGTMLTTYEPYSTNMPALGLGPGSSGLDDSPSTRPASRTLIGTSQSGTYPSPCDHPESALSAFRSSKRRASASGSPTGHDHWSRAVAVETAPPTAEGHSPRTARAASRERSSADSHRGCRRGVRWRLVLRGDRPASGGSGPCGSPDWKNHVARRVTEPGSATLRRAGCRRGRRGQRRLAGGPCRCRCGRPRRPPGPVQRHGGSHWPRRGG